MPRVLSVLNINMDNKNDFGESMKNIGEGVKKISESMNKMSEGVNKMSEGIQRISYSVTLINGVHIGYLILLLLKTRFK
jgi:methyl-accepting chemotaxis protein